MSSSNAQALFQQGRFDEAERAAGASLQRQPRDVESINVLALIALRRGQLAQARQLLESSVAIAPDLAPTHHYLGRVHDAGGNAEGAVAAH
ncbi:MAG: tetratricopeptide repeat protein, partial [Steroidobacter sp.]